MTSRGLTSILRVHKKGPSVGLARTGQPRGHKSRDEPSHQRTPSSTRGVHALQAGRAKHHPRSPSRSEGARRGGKSRPRASGPENQAGRGATARRPDARGQPRPAQAEAAPRQAGRRPQSQSTKPHREPGAGAHTGHRQAAPQTQEGKRAGGAQGHQARGRPCQCPGATPRCYGGRPKCPGQSHPRAD